MKTKSPIYRQLIGAVAILASFSSTAHADDLLKNGDFASMSAGAPTGWKAYENKQELALDTEEITGDSKQSLRVDIVADGGKSLGQIVQKVPVIPGNKYVFTVDMKSTTAGQAIGQIKLIVGSSEIKRMNTSKSGPDWTPVKLEFDSGEANMVWVVLRYNQRADNINQKVWFANASLKPAEMAPAP